MGGCSKRGVARHAPYNRTLPEERHSSIANHFPPTLPLFFVMSVVFLSFSLNRHRHRHRHHRQQHPEPSSRTSDNDAICEKGVPLRTAIISESISFSGGLSGCLREISESIMTERSITRREAKFAVFFALHSDLRFGLYTVQLA